MSDFESMSYRIVDVHTYTYVCTSACMYTPHSMHSMWIHNTDFEEENKTITLTVPTQGSIPVISISNWIIWMHRVVASGFNYGLNWNAYKDGFGSSDSEDFWLDCKDRGWIGGLLVGSGEASPPDDIGQLPSALGMAGGGDSLLVLDWILDVLDWWRGCKLCAACQRICPRRRR